MTEHSGAAGSPAPGARWLYAWAVANVAVGVSSLLVPLYAVQLGGGGLLGGWLATVFDYVVTFAVAGGLVLLGSALVFGLDLFVPGAE